MSACSNCCCSATISKVKLGLDAIKWLKVAFGYMAFISFKMVAFAKDWSA